MNQNQSLHEAIARHWEDLEAAFGPEWHEVEPKLAAELRELEAGVQASVVRLRIEAMLAPLGELWSEIRKLSRSLRQRRSAAEGLADSAPATSVRYSVVSVHYGTDRKPSEIDDPDAFFTGERGSELQFGVARVAIPDDHRMGRLERPRAWRLEFRQNPEKHVALLDVTPLDALEFLESARTEATDTTGLVFVHGYNVGFAAAVRRSAQIAYDLDFKGVPLLFSWPSEGKLLRYDADGGNAQWAEGHFREFLRMCASDLGLNRVHVVAHSMGNRTLVEVLGSVDFLADVDGAALGQVVFAAPDIDADRFKTLATRFGHRAARFTLYASSRDKALVASERLHMYPRAGNPGPSPVIVAGVDTIDATGLDTDLMGHAYVGDNRSILSDIFLLVRADCEPAERFGLRAQVSPAGTYWRFAND